MTFIIVLQMLSYLFILKNQNDA